MSKKEITKTIDNLIFPMKTKVSFKTQERSTECVVMYIEVEKSIFTKDYKNDSRKTVMRPIARFNKDSPFAKTLENLYRIHFSELF